MSRMIIASLILFLMLAAFACGGETEEASDNPFEKDENDDWQSDDDAGGDDDTPPPAPVAAPDQFRVVVRFETTPVASEAEDASFYSITSDSGSLDIESASFDAETNEATLKTAKQKLGVTYTLDFNNADVYEEFPSADTAKFWATDFGDSEYGDYELTAYRAVIGKHGVIYLEQGMQVMDLQETINDFDELMYPIETSLYASPDDIDGNGRILILGLDGGDYYGGYFTMVNSLSDDQAMEWWGLHSNEMEMIYINASYGTLMPTSVVPHEFQHLLYSKAHDETSEYWAYHDEGLAETAVHAVYGINQYAIDTYLADYEGKIGNGLSLVNWTWGDYNNYCLAYIWWTYVASQLDGVDTFGEIFDLDTGNPDEVSDYLENKLGKDFASMQIQFMLANWLQESSGEYSYGDMAAWDPYTVPTVVAGTDSLNLQPYAGAFFPLNQTNVNYPGTQGEHVVYVGIDYDNNVDFNAPFDIDGGILLVFNTSQDYITFAPEHSGPDIAASGRKGTAREARISPAWFDPPPLHPDRMDAVRAWQKARMAQIQP